MNIEALSGVQIEKIAYKEIEFDLYTNPGDSQTSGWVDHGKYMPRKQKDMQQK